MSRSNSYKRKKREAKRTVLLYCEGADDKAFLEYLKVIFAKDSGVYVKIKENYGCGANGVLRGVLKQIPADVRVCIYDIDTGVNIKLKQKVEKYGILCVENKPCLEAFLLEILESKNYSNYQKCGDCKKIFENKYLSDKKRKDKNNYNKIFPKELLLERAKKVKNLKVLIKIISGKYNSKN